tara:strand:- start:79434 stop:79826 length:393 start_codon:yes stop_codon:yes gene_type:complete
VRKTAKQRLAEREARGRSELMDSLFDPWIGGADNAATLERLGAVDPLDAAQVTEALRADIVPALAEVTRETQSRIRAALTVLAHSDGEEFRAYWLDLRAPFGTTEAEADAIFPVLAKSLGVRLPETSTGG